MSDTSFVQKIKNLTLDETISAALATAACIGAIGYFIRACKK